jgi:hypothetical protein
MNRMIFLMPRSFRFVGIIFFSMGLIIGMTRFYFGIKPEVLEIKVFAFYSSYLQTKFMQFISNNMIEELTGVFLISGLFLIAFSREKMEEAYINAIRLKSFFISAYLNFFFLLTSLFFTYGLAFVYMLMLNMGVSLLIYIIAFRILLFLNRYELLHS